MDSKRANGRSKWAIFLLVFALLVGGGQGLYAQKSTSGKASFLEVVDFQIGGKSSESDHIYLEITSHTFLRSDGSAVRLKDMTVRNDSQTPLESIAWCYYWGLDNEYANMFAEDAEGFLGIYPYMKKHDTYGWGMCVRAIFRNPVPLGGVYSYSQGITIGEHNDVSGGVIYAYWWTDPGYTEVYTEDVRWPYNHNGVVADPPPDELYQSQALWHRTNQSGKFEVSLEIILGTTMAVQPLSQGISPFDGQDIKWEDDSYGVGTYHNIGQWGCYLTSVTMAMRYYGSILGATGNADPGDLNSWLSQPLGAVSGQKPRGYDTCADCSGYSFVANYVLPRASQELFQMANPVIKLVRTENVQSISDFRDNLQDGQLGVLRVLENGNYHFVLVTGITEIGGVETLTINDPYQDRGDTTLYEQYNNDHTGLVRWFGIGDGSTRNNFLIVYANCPLHLMAIDEDGRRTGLDPVTGIVYGEIPDSSYYLDYQPGSLAGVFEPVRVFEVRVLKDTTFTIQAVGTGSGDYRLTFTGITDGGNFNTHVVRGYISQGEIDEFTVFYEPNTGLIYRAYFPSVIK